MFLISLLIIITIAISGSAAFFSVYGLAQTFANIFIPVIIMGIALEAGKLITASFLFNYWNKIGLWFKSYLLFAVLGLMVITSWGIFGFLGAAHQTDTIDLKSNQQRIVHLAEKKTEYDARLSNIDSQIKDISADQVSKKIRLIKTLRDEKQTILKNLDEINTEQEKLLPKQLATEAKVGPIIFIAKALGKDVDTATTYLIYLIMSVFDPLAVALTIAINIAIYHRAKRIQPSEASVIVPMPLPDDRLAQLDALASSDQKRSALIKTIRAFDN